MNLLLYKIATKIIGLILVTIAIIPASIMLFIVGICSMNTLGEFLVWIGKAIGSPVNHSVKTKVMVCRQCGKPK